MLRVEYSEHTKIFIERSEKLNALNSKLLKELLNKFLNLDHDQNVRVISLWGSLKAFVVGADLSEFKVLDSNEIKNLVALGHQLMNTIESLSKPVIAAVQSYCLGGGFELALACDFILCSKSAVFGFPETGLGLIPGYGGTQRLLYRINPATVRKLIYTAKNINAEQALSLGLVDQIIEESEFENKVNLIAEQLIQKGPLAIASAKRLINSTVVANYSAGLAKEMYEFDKLFITADAKEGITAFLEKRKPNFKGK